VYTPRFNLVEDEQEIRRMVAAVRVAWFVTTGADGTPQATLLPILWRGDTVVAHLARANRQWRSLADGAPALLIVTGPDAYITPDWYEGKRTDGRVVPTWNYSAVHLTGRVTVHHEPEWLRMAVTDLTDAHEAARERPWAVTDAPADHIDLELSGIVGIEVEVTGIEGKAKLSQNRSETDQRAVAEGLAAEPFPGAAEVSRAMTARLDAQA
jgi:transcriptional regulator